MLSIKPAQTRKVLRAHGSEREDKYRTATRPAELRVFVAEHGKKPFLRDGVVGELSKETQKSMVWRRQENIRNGSKLRQIKRAFVSTRTAPRYVRTLVRHQLWCNGFHLLSQNDKEIDYGEYTAKFTEVQREQAREARAAAAAAAPAPAAEQAEQKT